MNCYNTIDKSDGKLFKNWGSNSLYSDIVPYFIFDFRFLYKDGSQKGSYFQRLCSMNLNSNKDSDPRFKYPTERGVGD